jgi:hypothetical protein
VWYIVHLSVARKSKGSNAKFIIDTMSSVSSHFETLAEENVSWYHFIPNLADSAIPSDWVDGFQLSCGKQRHPSPIRVLHHLFENLNVIEQLSDAIPLIPKDMQVIASR